MKKLLTLSLAFAAAVTLSVAEDEKGSKGGKGKGGDSAARKMAAFKKLAGDDEKISKEEFVSSKAGEKLKEAGKDPEKAFGMRDKDKDGFITKEEFMKAGGKGKGGSKGKGGDDKGGKGGKGGKGKGGDKE